MSSAIKEAPLPDSSMLCRYAQEGHYTDCFAARLDTETSLANYVEAFYWLICRAVLHCTQRLRRRNSGTGDRSGGDVSKGFGYELRRLSDVHSRHRQTLGKQ